MKNIESVLILERLVFDKIEFNRQGFKNDNEIEFGFEIQIGRGKNSRSKVTIILKGIKEQEYNLQINLTGYFRINKSESMEQEQQDELINSNAVAIMMPYLRSQVSLLTAQPEVECVILPPFNINKMLEDSKE